MKRLAFITLLATFALFSCGRKETITQSLHVSLVNKTEKRLLYAVETTEKNGEMVSTGLDSVSVVFYRTIEIEHELLDFLAFEPFYSGVNLTRKTLLNFTDTSKYSYYSATLPQDMSAEDYIFVRHHFLSGNASYIKNGADYSVLYFTDSIANIMQKDYTMLDKFKEYYAHE
ncbi:MAG: hypothetical protein LBF67_07210 [Prevotellaceae bacterium]|jgi:hypothetical protein|nr:hypothetical protein [Prevotellaceae bacterium]